jgi:hypothetical protein
MTNRSKSVGTAAETAVVRALRQLGFPHAERRALAGAYDLGDITGTPGVVWEVKGGQAAKTASDGQVEAWLAETNRERDNAGALVGVLVMARSGIGAANADRWWAVSRWPIQIENPRIEARLADFSGFPIRMHLRDMTTILRVLGYGEPLVSEVPE